MRNDSVPKGSLSFEITGIPIVISPTSWLVLALLGGGLGISNGADISDVLIFMVAGMLCLLIHELGHAWVGRWMGSGYASIVIAGLGGATYTAYPPRTRAGYFLMVLAGPLASLLLGIFAGVVMGVVHLGNPLAGATLSFFALQHLGISIGDWAYIPLAEAIQNETISPFALHVYFTLFTVCLYWSLFNLLPIFPLDGGKLLGTLLDNYRIACIVGLVLSGLLCALSLMHGMLFNTILTGYLAFINWQYLTRFHKE